MSITVRVTRRTELTDTENRARCTAAARALLGARYRVAALDVGSQGEEWTAVATFDLAAALADATRPLGVPERVQLAWGETYGVARPPRRVLMLGVAAVGLAVALLGESSGATTEWKRWANEQADRLGFAEWLQSERLREDLGRLMEPAPDRAP